MLVALVAPVAAAVNGFVRAARDARAPLLLARPSGAADEKGPEEARDDTAFVESALKAADELRFAGPMALLKEPPRAGSAVPEPERVWREMESGFTGVAILAGGRAAEARDAALAASAVCQYELGLEVVPLGGSAEAGAELARQLGSRGAAPSALRIGYDEDAAALARELPGIAISSTQERPVPPGVRQLVAAGPFLRALLRSAPPDAIEALQRWADEKGASLEQSAARHQRLLRELSEAAQEKLEALCAFEGGELLSRMAARDTGRRLAERVGALHAAEK